MGTTAERLGRLVAPVAEELGLSVYDVEEAGGTLRVLLDRSGGIDVDDLATATRRISAAMDADGTFTGASGLEVSSPGLERRLRTPEHWAGAVGERVKVKLRPGVDGDRRVDGELRAVDGGDATVVPDGGEPRTVSLADVTSAHTVFEWGPAPKPGGGSKRSKSSKRAPARDRTPPPERPDPSQRRSETPADHSEATP